MSEISRLLQDARTKLAGAPREMLGEWLTPRAVLGVKRSSRIVEVGSAWHVGTLLLDDEHVMAVGEIIRAQDPGRRGYTAESARERAAVREAARIGKIAEGTIVHVGWQVLDPEAVESGPLRVVDGVPMIRWSTAGMLMPLESYLRERVELALHPLPGAN